jgi:hypothetical protein
LLSNWSTCAATPWFVTFNYLQSKVPQYEGVKGLARNAVIGMCASFVSDCVSNSLRVIKTVKQTSAENMGYGEAVKGILKKDGVAGLFGRDALTPGSHSIGYSIGPGNRNP